MGRLLGASLAIAAVVGLAHWVAPGMSSQAVDQIVRVARIASEGVTVKPAEPPAPPPAAARDQPVTRQPQVFSAERSLMPPPVDRAAPSAGSKRPVDGSPAPRSDRQQAATARPYPDESLPHRLSSARPGDGASRQALAAGIQDELRRVGCYQGDIDGDWSSSTRRAMKAFTDRVNASLPVDEPDYILLTLLQGHAKRACGAACPTGQEISASGRCEPRAILARTEKLTRPAVVARDAPARVVAPTAAVDAWGAPREPAKAVASQPPPSASPRTAPSTGGTPLDGPVHERLSRHAAVVAVQSGFIEANAAVDDARSAERRLQAGAPRKAARAPLSAGRESPWLAPPFPPPMGLGIAPSYRREAPVANNRARPAAASRHGAIFHHLQRYAP